MRLSLCHKAASVISSHSNTQYSFNTSWASWESIQLLKQVKVSLNKAFETWNEKRYREGSETHVISLSMSPYISLSLARPSICTCECHSWSRSVGSARSSTRWTCTRSVPHDAPHVCCIHGHSTASCSRPARQMCGYSGAPESRPRPTAGPPRNNWVTCWGRWAPPGQWACAAVPFLCDGTCAWCGLAPVRYSHNAPLGSSLHAQRMPWSSNMSLQHRSLRRHDSGSPSTMSWPQPTWKQRGHDWCQS